MIVQEAIFCSSCIDIFDVGRENVPLVAETEAEKSQDYSSSSDILGIFWFNLFSIISKSSLSIGLGLNANK